MAGIASSLNFPRMVIVVSLVASGVIGWLDYRMQGELAQLEDDVAEAPITVQRLQTTALELETLMKLANKEGLKGQDDPELYIRRVAQMQHVNIGDVNTDFSSSEPIRGVEDLKYKIKPSERTSSYARGAIANFLYKLEAESRRVRVTQIKIDPAEKVDPGEIGNDFWTFEAEITSRRKKE